MAPEFRVFPDRDALASALSAFAATAIANRLAAARRAAVALSGGRTPGRFFDALSQAELDWSLVSITLVDERWVPETSDRSNAAFIRRGLLQGKAAAATFLPLWRDTPEPEPALAGLAADIRALPLPFACTVLGMGPDGHTASFFPGGDGLAAAIDPAGSEPVAILRAPAAGEPRVTLTLPLIAASDALALHIEGEEKRAVFEAALGPGPTEDLPIRSVLRQPRPLTVFWCP
jgi:6-phosphogluconolactonase